MIRQENFLTVVDASKICGVTRATVWRWIKSGQLKAAITAGGHHRISEVGLHDFMDKKKMPTRYRGNRKKKILVVDDDPTIRKYLSRILNRDYFELDFAADGFEAGVKTMKFEPELITLDLFMPKMDGFKVCQQIKENPDTSGAKIIAVSGHDTEMNRKKIADAGADAFHPKPIDSITLIAEIERLLK